MFILKMLKKIKHIIALIKIVPIEKLLRVSAIINIAPIMLLAILYVNRQIDVDVAIYSAGFIFVISVIFSVPYLINLISLTNYVKSLAYGKIAKKPNLQFLNNVEELSDAIDDLQKTWDYQKNRLSDIAEENQLLIDNIPQVVLVLDDNFDVLRYNNHSSKVIKKSDLAKIDNDFRKNYHNKFKKDRKSEQFTYLFKERYFDIISRQIKFENKKSMLVIMHDITEQKDTEQSLNDFIANASHEIRTPLTTIIGFLESFDVDQDKKQSAEIIDILRKQSSRINILVNDLLSISKLEAKQGRIITDYVVMEDVVANVIRSMKLVAHEKNININNNLNGKNKVLGEVNELMQAFENIINNSIKYSDFGSNINISNNVDNGNLSIIIEDEGEGIAKEDLDKITDRFYRVDKSRSRRVGGTGLGLSIVNQIVKNHKAELKISSEIGKGSRFELKFFGVKNG